MNRTFRIACATLLVLSLTPVIFAQEIKPFFNETMSFSITWKGVYVGRVTMKTAVGQNNQLKSVAKVIPTDKINGIYYVQGSFGAVWDYVKQKSVFAYEEAYQGDMYQKRSYRFNGNNVAVSKHEIRFTEFSYPHKGKVSEGKDNYNLSTDGYADLLGAFYTIRTLPKKPQVGDVEKIKVLPAGSRKILILQIIDKKTIDVPVLGKKEVLHVKTALADPDTNKIGSGGSLFFNTKSQIEMYITNDGNYVPVKMWTTLPLMGTVYVNLASYSQP
ncbi:MAG: DUF3108 domain-containing protein [Leptospiraceae bacterium]|nr:DUF3108 domain-containing protein [Leptospiraceae bacterium]